MYHKNCAFFGERRGNHILVEITDVSIMLVSEGIWDQKCMIPLDDTSVIWQGYDSTLKKCTIPHNNIRYISHFSKNLKEIKGKTIIFIMIVGDKKFFFPKTLRKYFTKIKKYSYFFR